MTTTSSSPLLSIPTISYLNSANACSRSLHRCSIMITMITAGTLSCLGHVTSTTDQSTETSVLLRALRFGRLMTIAKTIRPKTLFRKLQKQSDRPGRTCFVGSRTAGLEPTMHTRNHVPDPCTSLSRPRHLRLWLRDLVWRLLLETFA